MDSSVLLPAVNGLANLSASLITVLWFALLMRGRGDVRADGPERLARLAGAAALALAGGCGLWAGHWVATAGLSLPWTMGFRSGWLFSGWLMAVAGAAALLLVDLQGHRWPQWRLRLQMALVALLWPLQQVLNQLSLEVPPNHAWMPSWPGTALMAVAAVGAVALVRSERAQALGHFVWRLWLAAGLYGLCHGLALEVSLAALTFPADAMAGTAPSITGAVVWVLASAATLILAVGLFGALADARAQAQRATLTASLDEARERLREQALADPLTRLPNRTLFEERLAQRLLLCAPDAADALAVMFIDLDGFKPINDSFGHAAGDVVLGEVGRRLQAALGPGDLAARVGGDEFVVLVDLEQGRAQGRASSMAQAVLRAISDPYRLPNHGEVKLSCSVGIVTYPSHGPGSKLIANADAAMYAAKRAGGSTFAYFEPGMDQDAKLQLALQHDLRAAIERNDLELYYQPKVHALSGQITGAEALVRWNHPKRGMILPSVFIPVAERFGLISHLGYWVIEEACRQIQAWRAEGLRMRVAVNLSMQQLRQDDLVPRIRAALLRHQVEPAQLTFEITESVAMEDATVRALGALADVGVSMSIDDFGTAYSNFAALRKLPVQQLKIDRSLFTDIDQSGDALAVVDAMIKMAHALGLKVVAEGVETDRQRDLLLALHCDEFQGFLYARPMSAQMLSLWALDEGETHPVDFRPSLYGDSRSPTLQ